MNEPLPTTSPLLQKSESLEPRALTIPGTGGTLLSTPPRAPVAKIRLPAAQPSRRAASASSVSQEMAEADSIQALTRSGGVRLKRRITTDPQPDAPPLAPAVEVSPVPPPPPNSVVAEAPAKEVVTGSVPPPFKPLPNYLNAGTAASGESFPTQTPIDTLRTAPGLTIFKRKAKLADVARIILPTTSEDAESPASPTPEPEPEPPATIIPAAFPVAVETGSMLAADATDVPQRPDADPVEIDLGEKTPSTEQRDETADTKAVVSLDPAPEEALPPAVAKEAPETETASAAPEPEKSSAPSGPIEEESSPVPANEPETIPVAEAELPPPVPPPTPQVETEVQKPEPSADPTPQEDRKTLIPSPEKKEFLLANGERILGHILSETPEALYVDHGTLGVLTIPRNQIAKRPIEIILINGDRLVGDLIAETPDSLYVRHASLGMVTVPRSQRSTRVVEAILKDGDRILGEVLGETENFTVIRSATLGTVAVPHNKVAMLNRKIEQIQMKALPPAATESKDEASA